MRKRALLAFSLPLAAVGTLAGHAAGYAIVGTSHRDALAHGYLVYAPPFLALCLSAAALALALRLTGRMQGPPAAWPFALIAPLAFGVQELVERLAVGLPPHAMLEPAVYVGLAAQLPLALVAFLVAKAMLRVADEAARALTPRPTLAFRPAALRLRAPSDSIVATRLVFGRLGRAPPR